MFRSTKIVATLGPASATPDVLERMVRAGVDVVRLNFSHGTAEDHLALHRLVDLRRRDDALLDEHLRQFLGEEELHVVQASLDQIIHTVTCRMGVERDLVLSNSRQREFTLVRALIAWYATERGVATLSEVARCLRDEMGETAPMLVAMTGASTLF